jgi:hypothetical protein
VLLTRYMAITVRQRLSRRMAEATRLGLALEGLTAVDRADPAAAPSLTGSR